MNDLTVGIVSGIIATYLAKWLQYIFKGDESTSGNTSKEYIDRVKREFYFSFPTALLLTLLIINGYVSPESFLYMSVIIATTILFALSLSAFICAIEVIKELTNSNANQETNNKAN